MKNEAYHNPLHPLDTDKQTFGCRHTQPNICNRNRTPKICAFVRTDKLCVLPPISWKKQYIKLKTQNT